MTMVVLPLAFVPALGFLALRSFLKAHPSATSEDDVQFLLNGLKLASISAAALPTLLSVKYITSNSPISSPFLAELVNRLWLPAAIAGGVVNLIALIDCLHERGGASLLTAFFVAILQVCWLLTFVLLLFGRGF
jgi:hypothetical protein